MDPTVVEEGIGRVGTGGAVVDATTWACSGRSPSSAIMPSF